MNELLQQTQARIFDRIQFSNQQVADIFKGQTATDFALAIATVNVSQRAVTLGLDPLLTTNAVTGLAQILGEPINATTPVDRLEKIKSLVNELIDDADPELESLLEAYFDAYFAFEAKMNYNNNTYRIWLGGNIVPSLRSELGNALCTKSFKDGTLPDFSATWQYDPKSDEWWISLRGVSSRSPDLSAMSKSFGGGGHILAAGFTIKSVKGLKEVFIY